ncbi:MAG TPA: SAV_2336 N-terminal domain-related protein [Spirillospora sp.]|nr:SAV_2336 N-terminal domain-related protein [Spirillospora sp.]
MIDRLREVLGDVSPQDAPDARELSEMLWLACHIAPARDEPAPGAPAPPRAEEDAAPRTEPAEDEVAPPPPEPAPEPRSALHPRPAAGTAPSAGTASEVLVPTAPMLSDPLGVQRALRPVKRRVPSRHRRELDEDATADRIADTRLWTPVLVPESERWLTLTLVVDTGPTMRLWRPLARELTEVLLRQGAFQNVGVAYLDATGGVSSAPGAPPRAPGTVQDASGRHAVLLLSDCSGPHWWNGRAAPAVRRWAQTGPTAILQPLAESLWRRTAAPTTPGRAVLPRPGGPNTALRFTPLDGAPPPGVPVPVLEVAPRWFGAWARLVSGAGPQPAAIASLPSRPSGPAPAPRDVPVAERVRRFLRTASPDAAELAAHVAVSVPSLPVMRLIQHGVLGGSDPGRLAEVLLSGLLRPLDDVRYEFVPGAREALLDTLPRPEAQHTRRVLEAVSAEIERRAGRTAETFRALLAAADGPLTLTADTDHFALIPNETRTSLVPSPPDVPGFPEALREDYEPVRLLLAGSWVTSYLVRPLRPDAGVDLAVVKVLEEPWSDQDRAMLRSLAGPARHLARIYDHGDIAVGGATVGWYAQEYCRHGSLDKLIHEDSPPADDGERRRIVASLAECLHHWQDALGLTHTDLQPASVLLRSRDPYELVIGDVRGAAPIARRTRDASPLTARYAAPELLNGELGEPGAWWALGVIAHELLLCRTPFDDLTTLRLMESLGSGGRPPPIDDVRDPEWRRLISGLLTIDPDQRWGYDEVRKWARGAGKPAPPPRLSAVDDVLELNGAGLEAAYANAWRLPISIPRLPCIGHDPDGNAFAAPSLDLVAGNSGLVVGDADARRHVLQVIALALAAKYSPSHMRFAFAGLGDSPLRDASPLLLPHVLHSDEELLGRPRALQNFIDFLLAELDTRRRHSSPEDLPHLVVMADVSLTFPSSKREVGETLLQLAQRGTALGVHVILASSTVESSTIWDRFLPLLGWRIVASRLPPAVLRSVLGRASLPFPAAGTAYLFTGDGDPRPFSPAPLPPEADLFRFISHTPTSPPDEQPEAEPPGGGGLPERIGRDELGMASGGHIPIGVQGEARETVALDFRVRPHLAVYGNAGTGKTNVLRLVVQALRRDEDAPLYVIDPGGGLRESVLFGPGAQLAWAETYATTSSQARDLVYGLARRLDDEEQRRDVFLVVDDQDLLDAETFLPIHEHLGVPEQRLHLVIARTDVRVGDEPDPLLVLGQPGFANLRLGAAGADGRAIPGRGALGQGADHVVVQVAEAS